MTKSVASILCLVTLCVIRFTLSSWLFFSLFSYISNCVHVCVYVSLCVQWHKRWKWHTWQVLPQLVTKWTVKQWTFTLGKLIDGHELEYKRTGHFFNGNLFPKKVDHLSPALDKWWWSRRKRKGDRQTFQCAMQQEHFEIIIFFPFFSFKFFTFHLSSQLFQIVTINVVNIY